MVEDLRVAVEAVRVVTGWRRAHEIGVEPERGPLGDLFRRRLFAADDPSTSTKPSLTSTRCRRRPKSPARRMHRLQIDEQLRHRLALRLPLRSHPNAIDRILDAVERAR